MSKLQINGKSSQIQIYKENIDLKMASITK